MGRVTRTWRWSKASPYTDSEAKVTEAFRSRHATAVEVVQRGGVEVLALSLNGTDEGESFIVQFPDDPILEGEPYTINNERGVVVESGIEAVEIAPGDLAVTFHLTGEASEALRLPRETEFVLDVPASRRGHYIAALRRRFLAGQTPEFAYSGSPTEREHQSPAGSGVLGEAVDEGQGAEPAELTVSAVDASPEVVANLQHALVDAGLRLTLGDSPTISVASHEECRDLSSCVSSWLNRSPHNFELSINGPFADSTLSMFEVPNLEETILYMVMAAAGYE